MHPANNTIRINLRKRFYIVNKQRPLRTDHLWDEHIIPVPPNEQATTKLKTKVVPVNFNPDNPRHLSFRSFKRALRYLRENGISGTVESITVMRSHQHNVKPYIPKELVVDYTDENKRDLYVSPTDGMVPYIPGEYLFNRVYAEDRMYWKRGMKMQAIFIAHGGINLRQFATVAKSEGYVAAVNQHFSPLQTSMVIGDLMNNGINAYEE